MDANEVAKEVKEILTLSEIRKQVKNNSYLFLKKSDIYLEINNEQKNKLQCSPIGGGFVKNVDITSFDFLLDYEKGNIKFVNEIPKEWDRMKVFHDHWENKFIYAYINPRHRWNGWFCPLVELSQIKKFNEIQKATEMSDDYSLFKIIDDNTISIKDYNEDEEIIIKSQDFDIYGTTIKVFDISLGWTWSAERIEK